MLCESLVTEAVKIELLAEDVSFLYLMKPAGLPVFPRSVGEGGDCVLSQLLSLRPEQEEPDWPLGFWAGILHRLDNRTSGLLVVARSIGALTIGRDLFTGGSLKKTYLFLSDQEVVWDQHCVEHDLAHHPSDRRKMVWRRGQSTSHRGQWRTATTHLRRLKGALWEATMTSGARHQIRLHAASVGLALRGDKLYGGGEGRFCLHHKTLGGWPEALPETTLPPGWPRTSTTGAPGGEGGNGSAS